MQILFNEGCNIIVLNIFKPFIITGQLLKTQQNSLLPHPDQQSHFHVPGWQLHNYFSFSHLPAAGQARAGRHILAQSPRRREFTGFFPGDCMYLLVILKGVTHLYFHAKTVTMQSSIKCYFILERMKFSSLSNRTDQ